VLLNLQACPGPEVENFSGDAGLHAEYGPTNVVLRSQFRNRNFALARKLSLSRQLRDARLDRGLSVAEVAERAGVSVASVYLWETGKTQPREANLAAVCKVLRLPVRATLAMVAG
jgi:DNA-binding XRE family transcriptional regulator